MDPLSTAVSILTVLQTAGSILAICYNFRAAARKAPWSLTRVIEEIRDLRNVLEQLRNIVEDMDEDSEADSIRKRTFEVLCDPVHGPLVSCLAELSELESKILPSSNIKESSKIKSFIQCLGWQLKDREATRALERLQRCKTTLNLAITADQSTVIQELRRSVNSLNQALEVSHRRIERLFSDESITKASAVLNWLSRLEVEQKHVAALKTNQPGTGEWLVSVPEFNRWVSQDNAFLWLSGFPGSGKTTLFANIIQRSMIDVKSQRNVLAYCYLDFRQADVQTPVQVVGSLLAQLFANSDDIPHEVVYAYETSARRHPRKEPTLSQLKSWIHDLGNQQKLIFLIDALDENAQYVELTKFFLSLRPIQNLKVLVTSRNGADLQDVMGTTSRIRLENYKEDMNADICLYINGRLGTDKRLQWLNQEVQKHIIQSIASKAAGMFRWVQCQLDSIATLRTIKAIKTALTQLPEGLYETYDRILITVPASDIEILYRILMWLSFSVLPLKLEELHEAIAVEPGLRSLDEESRLRSPQDILGLGQSLLDMGSSGTVHLAHLSVRDYLLSPDLKTNYTLSRFAMDRPQANKALANNCLTYLSFHEFQGGPCPDSNSYARRLAKYPLLKYAAIAWPYHAKLAEACPNLEDTIFDFLSPTKRSPFMSWVQVINGDIGFKWNLYPKHATALYYSASFGLDAVVARLIAHDANLDAPGSRFGGTALHGATLRHQIEVVRQLLQAGANVNKADFNMVTPLHTAVTHGRLEIIKILLDYGADVNAVDGMGETPREWAIKAGQMDTLPLLDGGDCHHKEYESPSSSDSIVWERTVPYFPDFYSRRSGLESSIIVSVRICGVEVI